MNSKHPRYTEFRNIAEREYVTARLLGSKRCGPVWMETIEYDYDAATAVMLGLTVSANVVPLFKVKDRPKADVINEYVDYLCKTLPKTRYETFRPPTQIPGARKNNRRRL